MERKTTMGNFQTAALGAVAGVTILLGLPVGRVRATSVTLRAFLNARLSAPSWGNASQAIR